MTLTPAQIKGRIKNIAKDNNADARVLLRIHMMERLLERVSVSNFRSNFIIKGGLLVTALVGVSLRSTMDIDTSLKDLNLSEDDAKRIIAEIKDNNEFKDPVKSRQFAFFTEQVNRGVDCIFIDYSSSYMDNITIQAFPLPGSILLEQSDEELRFAIKQLHQGELGFHTEIYTIKHLDFNGIPCIVLDLSHNPGRSRTCNYLFAMKERCITIALTAKHSTFQKRLQEFESVLKTLTFGKKTDRM